jgi:hypothetical protein
LIHYKDIGLGFDGITPFMNSSKATPGMLNNKKSIVFKIDKSIALDSM